MSDNYEILGQRLWPTGISTQASNVEAKIGSPSSSRPNLSPGTTSQAQSGTAVANVTAEDYTVRLRVALEIRERLEILHSSHYANFLKGLFPAFQRILMQVPVGYMNTSINHRLRNTVLEILNRLPATDVLKPYVPILLRTVMRALEKENEENALVCLKIIFDLHKVYRPSLEAEVQPFLNFVILVYRKLDSTVMEIFKPSPASNSTMATKVLPKSQSQASKLSPKSPIPKSIPTPIKSISPASAKVTATTTAATATKPSAQQQTTSTAVTPKPADATVKPPAPGSVEPSKSAATVVSSGQKPPVATTVASASSGTSAVDKDKVKDKTGGAVTEKKLGSRYSFQVLTECPLIVMLLFQLYHKYIPENIKALVPLMMKALKIRSLISATVMNGIMKSPKSELGEQFFHLLACQVKTLSFLTYLLRTVPYADLMKRYESEIAAAVVSLLRICPPKSTSTRKELLVATRHILATDFRSGFIPHVELFLDESLLIGPPNPGMSGMKIYTHSTTSSGKGKKNNPNNNTITHSKGAQPLIPSSESPLLPLAYSTLADLIHHVRGRLKLIQLSKVVYIFSRNVHDRCLPISIQTTSVRLLLNLVDNIFHNNEPEPSQGRELLVRVFRTLVGKIGSLRAYIPKIVQANRKKQAENEAAMKESINHLPMYYYVQQSEKETKTASAQQKSAPGVSRSPSPAKSNDTFSPTQSTTKASPDANPTESKQVADPTEMEAEIVKIILQGASVAGTGAGENEKTRWEILNIGMSGEDMGDGDGVKEVKALLQTMILGLKTVLWCICNYGKKKLQRLERQKQNKKSKDSSQIPKNLGGLLSKGEIRLVQDLLKWGLQCMPVYRENLMKKNNNRYCDYSLGEKTKSGTAEVGKNLSKKQQKDRKWSLDREEYEVFQHFASIFTVLDPHDFLDLFTANINLLYSHIVQHPPVITFARALMRNQNVSRHFVMIVMQYIIQRLDQLAGETGTIPNRYFTPPTMPDTVRHNMWKAKGEMLTFKGIPIAGANAAATLEGLGCDDLLLKSAYLNQQTPKQALNNQESKNGTPHKNEAAVLAQLCDNVFASLAMFSENPVDGIPIPKPPSAGGNASGTGGSSSSESPGRNPNDSDTAWGVTRILRDNFEMLMISCLTLTADMTTAPQRVLRHIIERKGNTELGLLLSSHLGRDCYLLVLRGMLGVVARRPKLQSLFQSQVERIIPASLSALSKLLVQSRGRMRASGYARVDLIAEIALLFTARIPRNDLTKYLSILQEPLEVAIVAVEHGNVELTRLALRVLESWVDNLDSNEIETLLLRKNQSSNQGNATFGHAVGRLLEPSPSPFGIIVLRIMGKLGRRIRKIILEIPRNIPVKPDSRVQAGLLIETFWQQSTTKKFNIRLDNIIQETCSFVEDLYHPNVDLIVDAFSLRARAQKGKAGSISINPTRTSSHSNKSNDLRQRQSFEDVLGKNNGSDYAYFKGQAAEFLMSCVAQVVNMVPPPASTDLLDLELKIQKDELAGFFSRKGKKIKIPFLETVPGVESQGLSAIRAAERESFKTVLIGLFILSCDNDTHRESGRFLKSLVRYIVLVGITNTVVVNTEIDGKYEVIIDTTSSHQRKGTPAFYPIGTGVGIDPTIINEVIVDRITTACPIQSIMALELIDTVVQTVSAALERASTPKEARLVKEFPLSVGTAVVNDLCERLEEECHSFEWTNRLGAVVGIRRLMRRLPETWTLTRERKLAEALFHIFETHTREIGREVVYHAANALYALVSTCYKTSSKSKGKAEKSTLIQREPQLRIIIGLSLQALIKDKTPCRSIARAVLNQIAGIHNVSVGTLLCQFPSHVQQLRRALFARSIRGRSRSSQIAVLESIAYVLGLRPCPFNPFPPESTGPKKKKSGTSTPSPKSNPISVPTQEQLDTQRRLVQILADAIVLTELHDPVTTYTSYSRCIVASTRRSSQGLFDTLNSPSCVYAGAYPFSETPYQPALRAAAVTLIHSILELGGISFATQLSAHDRSQKVRDRCVSLLFMSCISEWSAVSVAAHASLRIIHKLSQDDMPSSAKIEKALPKKVLDQCLRPLLQRLANLDLVSVECLQGATKLLSYFGGSGTASIATRLLDHLAKLVNGTIPSSKQQNQVADPSYYMPGGIAWKRGDEGIIAAEIIRVFKILPVRFFDDLITKMLFLETSSARITQIAASAHRYDQKSGFVRFASSLSLSGLQGYLSSPIPDASTEFFAAFPKETLIYFLSRNRLGQNNYADMFYNALSRSSTLRERLIMSTDTFLRSTFKLEDTTSTKNDDIAWRICFQGVRIIRLVSSHHPDWLVKHRAVCKTLLTIWRSKRHLRQLQEEELVELSGQPMCSLLCECFMSFFVTACTYKDPPSGTMGEAIQGIFEMLTIASVRASWNAAVLSDFYSRQVAQNARVDVRRAVIRYYLALTQSKDVPLDVKEAAIRLIVLPILAYTFREPKVGVSDFTSAAHLQVLIHEIVNNGLDEKNKQQLKSPLAKVSVVPPLSLFRTTPAGFDALQVQYLRLATLLVAHGGKELMNYRKELIKFAWNHLKSDDPWSKHWAYINICTFIDVYPTPTEIIIQVYVALLKEHSVDSRDLVQKALDILTPALPRRLPASRYIRAIKWTKKLIFDEGHKMPQLLHIWDLITRQPWLFYQHRNQFVPQLVNSLIKMGLPQSCSFESRKLSLDLAKLFFIWEKTHAVEENNYREYKQKGSIANTNETGVDPKQYRSRILAAADAMRGFKANGIMLNMVVHFIMRMALTLAPSKDPKKQTLLCCCENIFTAVLMEPPSISASSKHSLLSSPKPKSTSVLVGSKAKKTPSPAVGLKRKISPAVSAGNQKPKIFNIRFIYISKHIEHVIKTQKAEQKLLLQRQQQQQKVPSKQQTDNRYGSASGNVSSAGERKEDDGTISCILRILKTIIQSEYSVFAETNGPDMYVMLDPIFACEESSARNLFAEFVAALGSRYPSDSIGNPLNSPIKRHNKSSKTSPKQSAPASAIGKPFYQSLYDVINRRLLLIADDGKVEATQSKLSQQVSKKKVVSSTKAKQTKKGKVQSSSKKGGGKTTVQSKAKSTQQKAAATSRATKNVPKSQSPKPRGTGTLGILKLVQIICSKDTPSINYENEDMVVLSNGYSILTSKFIPALIRLANKISKELIAQASVRLRNAAKTCIGTKGNIYMATADSPTWNYGGSNAKDNMNPKDIQYAESAKALRITLALLKPRILSHEAYRRTFLVLIGSLLEKLDAQNMDILETILTLLGSWLVPLSSKMSTPVGGTLGQRQTQLEIPLSEYIGDPSVGRLTAKEKSQFIMKLSLLERLFGTPGSESLMTAYHDVLFRVYDSFGVDNNSNQSRPVWITQQVYPSFLAGTMSKNLDTRRKYFAAFRKLQLIGNNNTVVSRLQSIVIQDWSHMTTPFWIPVALDILLSSIGNHSVASYSSRTHVMQCMKTSTSVLPSSKSSSSLEGILRDCSDLFKALQSKNTSLRIVDAMKEISHGDCTGNLAHELWLEFFPMAWEVLGSDEKVLITQGLQVAMARDYHRSHQTIQNEAVQNKLVTVKRNIEDMSKAVSAALLTEKAAGYAADPYLESTMLASLRRVGTWKRTSNWCKRNVIQTMLQGVFLSRPMPYFQPEFLVYIGRTYGCIHTCIRIGELLLERLTTNPSSRAGSIQTKSPKKDAIGDKTKKRKKSSSSASILSQKKSPQGLDSEKTKRWMDALRKFYNEDLRDRDMEHGIIRQWSKFSPTFAGLSLEVREQWNMAQQVYEMALRRVDAGKGFYIVAESTVTSDSNNNVNPYDNYGNMTFSGAADSGIEQDSEFLGMFDDPLSFEPLPADDLMPPPNYQMSPVSDPHSRNIPSMNISTGKLKWKRLEVSQGELDLWEKRWRDSTKMLGDWRKLETVAKSHGDLEMLLESTCRVSKAEWSKARGAFNALEVTQQQLQHQQYFPGNAARIALYRVCIAVQEQKPTSDIDILWRQAANATLLDCLSSLSVDPCWSGSSKEASLVLCQRLTEIEDSVRLFSEVTDLNMLSDEIDKAKGGNSHDFAGKQSQITSALSRILRVWRTRLPGKCDSVEVWDDILNWRKGVFDLAGAAYKSHELKRQKLNNGEPLPYERLAKQNAIFSRMHDSSWTTIQTARRLRELGLIDISLSVLQELQASPPPQNFSLVDRFMQIREQTLSCLQSHNSESSLTASESSHLAAGLQMIASVDMSALSRDQRAEIFRIRAVLMESTGVEPFMVHDMFAKAVQVSGSHADAWLDWGRFSDRLMTMEGTNEVFPYLNPQIAPVTVGGYLQAILQGSLEARLLIPRILWLLHVESDCSGVVMEMDASTSSVRSTLVRHIQLIPVWVWLPWIPQLVASLGKGEAGVVTALLLHISKKYPQAVYYALRVQILETRDQMRQLQQTQFPEGKIDDQGGNKSSNAKEVMSKLHQMHPRLAMETETLLDEISTGFKKQKPIDEIYSALQRLLHKCLQIGTSSDEQIQLVVQPTKGSRLLYVWSMLYKVCDQMFSAKSLARSEEHTRVLNALRPVFERDFLPNKQQFDKLRNGPANRAAELAVLNAGGKTKDKKVDFSVKAVIGRLSRWKGMLEDILFAKRANAFPLRTWSRHLSSLTTRALEIPGQYLLNDGYSKPHAGNHIMLSGFCREVTMVRRSGYPQVRLGFRGANGHISYFLVQTAASTQSTTKADQRIVQLMSMANLMLKGNEAAASRVLRYSLPVVVPVHTRVRLRLDAPSMVSMEEIYLADRKRRGIDPVSIVVSRLIYDSRKETGKSENAKMIRTAAFTDICENHVPANILNHYISEASESLAHVYSMRTSLAKQLALSSLLVYLFSAGERTPSKMVLDLNKCCAFYDVDLAPKYILTSTGILESVEKLSVPFRLTRNICNFISPAGATGLFANTLHVAAACLSETNNLSALEGFLDIFMRDDLVAWNLSRTTRDPNDERRLYRSKQLHSHIQNNVREMILRLHKLAPNSSFMSSPIMDGEDYMSSSVDSDTTSNKQKEKSEYVELSADVASSLKPKEPVPLDRFVHSLIAQATTSENLACMDATWIPWF